MHIDFDLICTNTSSIFELKLNVRIDNFPNRDLFSEDCFYLNKLCYGAGGFKERGKSGADRKWWLFLLEVTMVSVPLQCVWSLTNSGSLVQCVHTHPSVRKTASDGAIEEMSKN